LQVRGETYWLHVLVENNGRSQLEQCYVVGEAVVVVAMVILVLQCPGVLPLYRTRSCRDKHVACGARAAAAHYANVAAAARRRTENIFCILRTCSLLVARKSCSPATTCKVLTDELQNNGVPTTL